MTRRSTKRKSPPKTPSRTPGRSPRKAGKGPGGSHAPHLPQTSTTVDGKAIAKVVSVVMERGGKTYVHHFTHPTTLHRVAGVANALVLAGGFKVDAKGFIHG